MSGESVRRAAVHGQTEWIKRLFASGANPCETDEVGLTPLHYAALNGHEECVITCGINDRGTNPDGARSWALQQQSDCGWSALHIAAWEGKNSVEIVKILLALGSDPWLLDIQGRTALDLAQQKFDETGSAVSEMIIRLLKHCIPSEAVVKERREEFKEKHWVQCVRRGNQASIGDYPTKKEHRAPIVPIELKVAEHFHIPFATESFQAIRGAYGVQALRNLKEACAEVEVNATRRFELAHSQQLRCTNLGQFDFRTEEHLKHENTKIDWKNGNVSRHIIGQGPRPIHNGYLPFHYAAYVKPQTKAQKKLQETRKDPFPPHHEYPQRPFKSYAYVKWKEIEYGPELFD